MFEMPSLTSNPVIDRISEQHLRKMSLEGSNLTCTKKKNTRRKRVQSVSDVAADAFLKMGVAPLSRSPVDDWDDWNPLPEHRVDLLLLSAPPTAAASGPRAARIPRKLKKERKRKKKKHPTGAQHPNEIVKRYDLLWHQSSRLTTPALCCLLIFEFQRGELRTMSSSLVKEMESRCFLIDFVIVVSTGEALFL